MGFKAIMWLVNFIFVVLLIVAIFVEAFVIYGMANENKLLLSQKNQLSQTYDNLYVESLERERILVKQNNLLELVKNAKTVKEYVSVWKKINAELSR